AGPADGAMAAGGRPHGAGAVRAAAALLRPRTGAVDARAGAAAGAGRLVAFVRRADIGGGDAARPGPAARGAQARPGQPRRAGGGGAGLRARAAGALGAKADGTAPGPSGRAAGGLDAVDR